MHTCLRKEMIQSHKKLVHTLYSTKMELNVVIFYGLGPMQPLSLLLETLIGMILSTFFAQTAT